MTTNEPKQTVGIMLKRTNHYGTDYIEATVMNRIDDNEYPTGVGSWYSFEGKPFLDGLAIRGHIGTWTSDDKAYFSGSKPAYYDLHCVEHSHAKAMGSMLAKIAKQVERDAATENGDLFLAFARAVGAQWVCYPRRGRINGAEWRNSNWSWYGLTDGRNLYRAVIAEAVREEQERQDERRKPTEPVGETATA